MSIAVRPVSIILVAIVALLVPGHAVAAGSCWWPPVEASVSDPFRAPRCRWCRGNRGIEFATAPGVPVIAVEAGWVTFAGSVAGTGYVVVRLGNGDRVTYGNVTNSRLSAGDLVVRGMRVGDTDGALHLGLRHGDRYVDPAPRIGVAVFTPRLIPSSGAPAAAGRPPRLRCAHRSPGGRDPGRKRAVDG